MGAARRDRFALTDVLQHPTAVSCSLYPLPSIARRYRIIYLTTRTSRSSMPELPSNRLTAKSIDALKHPCISPSLMPPNSKVTAKLPLLSLHILNEQKARHSDLGLDFRESGTPIRLLPSGVTRVWTWGAVQVRVTVRAIAMGVVTIMDTPTGRVGGRRVLRSQMTTLL